MKRFLTVFLSFMLVFTSVFVSNNKVYAEEDFTVTVSLDENENVIIRSNDEDWIDAFNTTSKYENDEWFHGSVINMINEDTGNLVNFDTIRYPEREDVYINFEVRSDDQGSYVFISKENLIDRFTVNDEAGEAGVKYYFRFEPYGYDTYETDANSEGGYVVFSENLLKQPPTLRVEETENGNLIISGDNSDTADYFDTLLYHNTMESYLLIDNEFCGLGGALHLNADNNIVLPKSAFISYISEDKTIELHLPVYGYLPSILTFDYVKPEALEAPVVTVSQDHDTGDLWITADDSQWLQELKNGTSLNDGNWHGISFNVGNGFELNNDRYVIFAYDNENNVTGLTITHVALLANHIPSGNGEAIHFPSTESYGAVVVDLDFDLDACANVGEDFTVSMELDDNCNLIIRSNDEDWLDALCVRSIYENGRTTVSGGQITIINAETDNGKPFFNVDYRDSGLIGTSYELMEDAEGKYIRISDYRLKYDFSVWSGYEPEVRHYFDFAPYGYVSYTTDPNSEGGYVIFPDDLVKQLPDLVVTETEDGDIILGCNDLTDEEYLTYLNALYYSDDSYVRLFDIEERISTMFYLSDEYNEDIRPYLSDNQLILTNALLANRGIVNKQYSFDVYVAAYPMFYWDITLEHQSLILNENPTVTIIQDPDTGDLWITADDSQWMKEFAESDSSVIYFGRGYEIQVIGGYNDYVSVMYDDQENVTALVIAYDVLLGKQIMSGEQTMIFTATESYGEITVDLDFDLDACAEIPEDLNVTVSLDDDDNLIIRSDYDEWLEGLIYPDIIRDEKRIVPGGSILMQNAEYDAGYAFYNSRDIIGEYTSSIVHLEEDEQGKYILVYKEDIQSRLKLLNEYEDGNKYVFTFWSHGFGEYTTDADTEGGYIIFPDGFVNVEFTVTVAQDAETGDLIVTSNDANFIRKLAEPSRTTPLDRLNGGYMLVEYPEEGQSIYIGNDIYTDDEGGDPVYTTYIYASGNQATVSKEDLSRIEGIHDGEGLIVHLRPQGIFEETIVENVTLTGLDTINKVPSRLNVEETESGDIVISADTTDENYDEEAYLSYLNTLVNNNDSYVELIDESTETGNRFYNYQISEQNKMYIDNNQLIIPNSLIVSYGFTNGDYKVNVVADGYEEVHYYVTLTKACNKAPEVTVAFNANGDLEIITEDETWLSVFAQAGGVEFNGNGINRYVGTEAFDVQEGKVVLSRSLIQSLGLAEGTYSVRLFASGYEKIYRTIDIQSVLPNAEVSIDGSTGDLIITCDDTDFLNALITARESQSVNGEYSESVVGGYAEILFPETDHITTYFNEIHTIYIDEEPQTETYTYLLLSDNTVSISNYSLFEREEVYDCDNAVVTLHAPGYDNLTISGVTIDNVRDPNLPNDISVSMNDAGDIFIESEDIVWLAALAKAWDHESSPVIRGGRVLIEWEDDTLGFIGVSLENYDLENREPELLYSEGDQYLMISNETLKNNFLLNKTYNVSIEAFGYVAYKTTLTITGGLKQAPGDIGIEVVDGDIVVTSSDTDWLQAFGGREEHASLVLDSDEYNFWYGEEYLDISDNQVILTAEKLSETSIIDGTYTVVLRPYGYAEYRIEGLELSGYISVVTAEVTVDGSTGNLIITCDDTDFLNALAIPTESIQEGENYSEIRGGSISLFYPGEDSSPIIENRIHTDHYYGPESPYYEYDSFTSIVIVVEGNQAIVSNADLLNHPGVHDGDDIAVYLDAVGYRREDVENVSIRNVRSADLPDDVEVSVDEDGTIIITSEDSTWLQALCIGIDPENGITGNASGHVTFWIDEYHGYMLSNIAGEETRILYEDGCVKISGDSLIRSGVRNGEYPITMSAYKYIDLRYSENIIVTAGIQDVPEDVRVYADDNGNIVITSEDTGWLDALCEPYVQTETSSAKGGRIVFDDEHQYYNTDDTTAYTRNGTQIVINSEKQIVDKLYNGEYTVKLQAYGYDGIEKSVTVTGGYNYAPEDAHVYLTDGNDLVIASDDETWLERMRTNERSYVRLHNEDTQENYDFSSSNLILVENDSLLVVPFELMFDLNIKSGTYTIYLCVYGYDEVVQENVELNAYEHTPITVSQNGNGDLIITSDNADYMQALVKENEYLNDGGYVQGGRIEIIQEGSRNVYYSNVIDHTGEQIQSSYTYTLSADGVQITLERQNLINRHVYSGDATVILHVPGYDNVSREIPLEDVCNPVLPDDVVITVEGNGDITIVSEDTVWLNALCSIADHDNNIFPGEIIFIDENNPYDIYISNDEEKVNYTYENGVVTFSSDAQISSKLDNSSYYLTLCAYGYKELRYDAEITVTGGYGHTPENTGVSFNGGNDLVITSDDGIWLQRMSTNEHSYVRLHNNETGVNYNFDNSCLNQFDGNLVIPFEALQGTNVKDGTYTVYLYAYGYDEVVQNDVELSGYEQMEITVSQNADGDLVVTSSDTQWIAEMADLNDADNTCMIVVNNAFIRVGSTHPYLEFDTEGEDYVSFKITYEALLANHVPSRIGSIMFPTTANYEATTVDLGFVLDACKPVPEGLRVEETEEGIRFYFDDPTAEQLAFLSEMTHLTLHDGSTQKDVEGSAIEIYSQDYGGMTAMNEKWFSSLEPDINPGYVTRIFLSSDESYAYISHDAIMNSGLRNSESGIYNISLWIYGYEVDDSLHLEGLQYGINALRDDFTFEASLVNGDLIIRSNDEDWMEAVCHPWTRLDDGSSLFGSYLIINGIESNVYFGNDYTPGNSPENQYDIQYEVRTDEQGEKYIFVSRDILIKQFGSKGEIGLAGHRYNFEFETYGYESFYSSTEIKGQYIVFDENLVKETPELNIIETGDGNIVITSEDPDIVDYFDSLLNHEYSETYLFSSGNGLTINNDTAYVNDENEFVIERRHLRRNHIEDGEIELNFYVFGYLGYRTTLVLEHQASSSEVDVTVEQLLNGDLLITSTDQRWLNDMGEVVSDYITINSKGLNHTVYFGRNCDEDYIRISREEDGNVSYITVLYKGLLAERIASSEDAVEIRFPETAAYSEFYVEIDGLNACKETPEGLKVMETPEGIRFYFDNPTQVELDYLEAMIQPAIWDHSVYPEGKYTQGSIIDVYHKIDGSASDICAINGGDIDENGKEEYWYDEICLADDGTYVYIPTKKVKESSMVNSDTIIYSAVVSVYGYENYYNREETILHFQIHQIGNEALPEGFKINAYLDDDNNLYIRKPDTEDISLADWNAWAEATYQPARQDAQDNYHQGSFMHIINAETGKDIRLDNYIREGQWGYSIIQYELRTDDNSEEKYLFVSRETLIRRFADYEEPGTAGSKYFFGFDTIGYENYNSDPDTEGQYVVLAENLIKETPLLSVTETDEGDVIIGFGLNPEDENYQAKYEEYVEYINTLYNGAGNEIVIFDAGMNEGAVLDSFAQEYSEIRLESNEIIIPNSVIISHNIVSGNRVFEFRVLGYTIVDMPVTLEHGCKEMFGEVMLDTDSDGNLRFFITSADDTQWLSDLGNKGNIHFELIMENGGYQWVRSISGNRLQINEDNAVLLREDLIGLEDGNYQIVINVYGYNTIVIDSFYLSGYQNQVSSDIQIYTQDGDLIIACNDREYMKALAAENVWYHGKNFIYTEGGRIEIKHFDSEGNQYYNAGFSNSREYVDNVETAHDTNYTLATGMTKIVLKRQQMINQHIYDDEAAVVVLHAIGYADIEMTVSLSDVCNPDVPDDVVISSEDNGDITITSEDTDWLMALCKKEDYKNNVFPGMIMFMNEHGGRDNVLYNESGNNFAYTYNDGKVTITSEALKQYHIDNCDYMFRLNAYGYKELRYYNTVSVTGGQKQVPEGISIRLNSNGDLVVYSENGGNEEYLQNLARWWIMEQAGSRPAQFGGYINFTDYSNNYAFWSVWNYDDRNANIVEEMIVYDETNNEVIVSRERMNGISGGSIFVELQSYGYQSLFFESFKIPFITVGSAEVMVGGMTQFFVNTAEHVTWSVDNQALATVDENGWLSAKDVGTVYLSAHIDVEGNDYTDTIPVTIKAPSNISITVTPTKANAIVGDTAQIIATVKNGDESYTVTYASSNEQIATVDETGLVRFLSAGKVTITSTAYGKSATSVFTVTATDKLVASIDDPYYDPTNGMEASDTVMLTVKSAGEIIDPSLLKYTSSNEGVAAVNEYGWITGLKPGSAVITAKLIDDPVNRSVTFTVKVYSRVADSLIFGFEDENGIVDMDKTTAEGNTLNVYLDAKTSLKKTFKLVPYSEDKNGEYFNPDKVTYAPVDSTVASVTADGTVTVKKAGQTAIKATVSSNPKGSDPVTSTVIVRVVDYAPRLEAKKATVNKYYDYGTDVKIYPIEGSEISEVMLLNSKTMEESDFIAVYDSGDNSFNITQTEAVRKEAKGKTYSEILRVYLTDGNYYDYAYSVVVNLTLPKTTVKASGTYNTALDYSTLKLDVNSAEPYSEVEFVDGWAEMDSEGNVKLLKKDAKGNYILKGTVYVYYEDYTDDKAFSKFTVSFKSVKTLPTVSLDAFSEAWLVNNTIILSKYCPNAYIDLLSSSDEYPVVDALIKEDYSDKGLTMSYVNGSLFLSRTEDAVAGSYKYTITPYTRNGIALKNLTLTVKVNDNLAAKVTLSPTSIKLNKNHNESVKVTVKVTDLPYGTAINSFVVDGTGVVDEDLNYDGETITFRLVNGDVQKGSYKLAVKPIYSVDGIVGTPIYVTVNVIDAAAKATVSVKGNLNQLDPLSKTNCIGTVKLTNIQGKVEDVVTLSEYVDAEVNENRQIIFTLNDNTIKDQTLKFNAEITLDTGDVLTAPVTVKVARKAPTVKLSQTTLNVYNVSERYVEVGRIALSELPFGEIKEVWFSNSVAYDLSYYEDEETREIVVVLKDAANLKSGSSTAITIKIDWEGDYGTYAQSLNDKTIKGLKTTTLKLTIKDASGTVKAK